LSLDRTEDTADDSLPLHDALPISRRRAAARARGAPRPGTRRTELMALLSVEEALARILADAAPLGAERVAIEAAHDRILAESVSARLTQPPFDASAMDGYAVRAADVAKLPARLTLIGESAAGHPFNGRVSAGEAVRIFTGAPVPEGADGIVIQEHT